MPDLKIPSGLKWAGGVAALLTAIATAWVQFGGGVPLTKDSTVITRVKMDIGIQDMRMDTANVKIRSLEMDALTRAMESDSFQILQYGDKPTLTDFDRGQIVRLERKIKNSQARWDKLLEAE